MKVIKRSPSLQATCDKYLNKIRGKYPLREGEKVLTEWKFDKQEAHAGQIRLAPKKLANGNIQKREVTVYAGDSPTLAVDTRVYSPSGKLLDAYHGIRTEATKYYDDTTRELCREVPATIAYAKTPKEINQIIKDEQRLNHAVQYEFVPY